MKPGHRTGLQWLLGAAGVVALVALLITQTEWVDEREDTPLSEALAQDGSLVARRFLGRLGPQVRAADDLSTLPPPRATLVLSAYHWNLIPGSSARLQRWVQGGGHLVLDGTVLNAEAGKDWLPISEQVPAAHESRRRDPGCRVLHQRNTLPAAWGDQRGLVACLSGHARLLSAAAPSWALDSDEIGTEVLRVPLGQGRVTAFAGRFSFDWQRGGQQSSLSNRGMLAGDNAALLAALVDPQPGGEVWFVTRVQRPPLPLWLWQRAAPAVALAALALALALWRGGLRFGPLQAAPATARRAFALQIKGTAAFLGRHQPAALHAAAWRALDEAAQQRLAGWRRLPPAARAAALARASGQPEATLASALQGPGRSPADTLAVLENTRRALFSPSARKPPA